MLQQQQQPQQATASASYPPPVKVPVLGITTNVQENANIPAKLVLPQTSKAPVYPMEAPFEFEVDRTALKVSKVEKLFK